MLQFIRKSARQRQTLASFDYQWRHLPDGDAMLSDVWFNEHVCEILAEITGVSASWFAGKQVLDAGCGQGRWTVGLRLGAEVTAVDFSEAGLERTRTAAAGFAGLKTMRVNLLDPPDELQARRFDMVFSFGVLHHTGDTLAALDNVARLVSDSGLIALYLYGSASWTLRQSIVNNWTRLRLAGLPHDEKVERLRKMYPSEDPHQRFDLLSPTINDRLTFSGVRARLERLGFSNVTRTVRSGEIYARGQRRGFGDVAELCPGPVAESMFIGHYARAEQARRDRVYERTFWELAARAGARGATSLAELCDRAGLRVGDFAGRSALVVSPDGGALAGELAAAGARVRCLTPGGRHPRGLPDSAEAVEASTLDDGSDRSDFVIALGSSIAISRRPDVSVERLAGRLGPEGWLIVETLGPTPEQVAHKARRILLKPYAFEGKIERLLRAHPDDGLAGAFARLSSRLPVRLTEQKLRDALERAGLERVECRTRGGVLVARGRRPAEVLRQTVQASDG